MLKELTIRGVGPAERFDITFADRLNLFTGDNGLGKSFLLDVAWWVCARDWPSGPAIPREFLAPRPVGPGRDSGGDAEAFIEATLGGVTRPDGAKKARYRFEPFRQDWRREGPAKPTIPGLVLYARVDGGFSVWDPARHYFKQSVVALSGGESKRVPAFHFSREEVWKGLADDLGSTISRGLIVDWLNWQSTNAPEFAAFQRVLERLSPSSSEPIQVADQPVRLPGPSVDRIPALRMPYGTVPITLASAGLRRIVALAYLMVWMWSEHKAAATANGLEVQDRLVIFIDEVEAHLHPQWQRRILPALVDVARELGNDHALEVQFIVATHAPLVLASIEPVFQRERDKLFHLELREADQLGQQATLRELPWYLRGDSSAWLTSEVFGLGEDRSVPAEEAIRRAREAMDARDTARVTTLESELGAVLSGLDPFWAEWHRFKVLAGVAGRN